MAETIKGINVVIGAETTGLSAALADVNKRARDIQSELKQVEKLLKLDPSNTELLAQKQQLLAQAVENTREKLDRLKSVQEQVNEQFQRGEITEGQYRAFQREVAATEQQLRSLEQQLRNMEPAVKSLGERMQEAGEKMKSAGEKMTSIGKDLSLKVTAPLTAAGVAAFKMAADLNDALGATEQIFGSAADSVKEWADNLESYYGIAEGEALEYANMMGSLLQNIGGLTQEEAAKQAQALVELAGDLTAMFGGTTADAVRALTGALKGNTAMLDNYGIACNDALIKTKALEMGLYDGKGQIDLAAKQAAILALIMEQTAAAQGQAAREADGASGSMRALTTELKNLATDVGEVLLPVITPFVQMLGDMVRIFGQLSPTTQKVIVAIAGIAAAGGPLLIFVGNLIKAVGTITALFGGMAAASGAAAAGTAAAGTAATGAAAGFSAMLGPIGLVIAAIAGLAAAAYLIIDNWNHIVEFFIGLWARISEATAAAWGAIQQFFADTWAAITSAITEAWNRIVEFLREVWDGLVSAARDAFGRLVDTVRPIMEGFQTFFSGAWDAIKNIFAGALLLLIDLVTGDFENLRKDAETIWNNLKDAFGRIWDGIRQVFSSSIELIKQGLSDAWENIRASATTAWDRIRTVISDIVNNTVSRIRSTWDGLLNWFRGLPSTLYQLGVDMFSRMRDAVITGVQNVRTAIINEIEKAIDWLRNLPDELKRLGRDMIQGLVDGIKNMIGKVGDAIRDIADRITGGLRNFLGIHSPSRVLMEIGEYTGEGFVLGLRRSLEAVRREAAELAGAVTWAFGSVSAPGVALANSGTTTASSSIINMDGLFAGATIIVRSDDDIRQLAREIWSMAQQAQRSLGGMRG